MCHILRKFAAKSGPVLVGLAMLGLASCMQRVEPSSKTTAVAEHASMKSAAHESGENAAKAKTSGDAGGRSAAESHQIAIDNFTFSPAELTISAGETVAWINRDDVPHTATAVKKPREFDSGALDTDQGFSHQFTARGTYEYFCAIHPHMTGKIIVQ